MENIWDFVSKEQYKKSKHFSLNICICLLKNTPHPQSLKQVKFVTKCFQLSWNLVLFVRLQVLVYLLISFEFLLIYLFYFHISLYLRLKMEVVSQKFGGKMLKIVWGLNLRHSRFCYPGSTKKEICMSPSKVLSGHFKRGNRILIDMCECLLV